MSTALSYPEKVEAAFDKVRPSSGLWTGAQLQAVEVPEIEDGDSWGHWVFSRKWLTLTHQLNNYDKKTSNDRPRCLEHPRPEGAESTLTENAASPFQAEPTQPPNPLPSFTKGRQYAQNRRQRVQRFCEGWFRPM
jgi:hypothetical protein